MLSTVHFIELCTHDLIVGKLFIVVIGVMASELKYRVIYRYPYINPIPHSRIWENCKAGAQTGLGEKVGGK